MWTGLRSWKAKTASGGSGNVFLFDFLNPHFFIQSGVQRVHVEGKAGDRWSEKYTCRFTHTEIPAFVVKRTQMDVLSPAFISLNLCFSSRGVRRYWSRPSSHRIRSRTSRSPPTSQSPLSIIICEKCVCSAFWGFVEVLFRSISLPVFVHTHTHTHTLTLMWGC